MYLPFAFFIWGISFLAKLYDSPSDIPEEPNGKVLILTLYDQVKYLLQVFGRGNLTQNDVIEKTVYGHLYDHRFHSHQARRFRNSPPGGHHLQSFLLDLPSQESKSI